MTEKKKHKSGLLDRSKNLFIAGSGAALGARRLALVPAVMQLPLIKPLFADSHGGLTSYHKLKAVADVNPNLKLIRIHNVGNSHYSRELPKGLNLGPEHTMGLPWNTFRKEHVALAPQSSPFVTAHELGHASGGLLKKVLQNSRYAFIGKVPIPVGGLAALGAYGVLGAAAVQGKKGEKKPKALYIAPMVAAYNPVVTQLEELRATLKAQRFLSKAKIKVPRLASKMLAQQGSYLLGGLAEVAPVAAGAMLLSKYLDAPKHHKNS